MRAQHRTGRCSGGRTGADEGVLAGYDALVLESKAAENPRSSVHVSEDKQRCGDLRLREPAVAGPGGGVPGGARGAPEARRGHGRVRSDAGLHEGHRGEAEAQRAADAHRGSRFENRAHMEVEATRPPNTRSLSPSAAMDVAPGSGMPPPGANSKCGDGRTSTRSRAASAGTTCATCVDPAVAVAKGPNAPYPRWPTGRPALARPITGAPPTGPFRGRTHRRSRVHRGLGRSRRRGRLRTALRRGREGSRRRRRSSGAAA